jgi:hypothetical protein
MTALSRTSTSQGTHLAASAVAAGILAFAALVLLSVLFALVIAVSMADRGRIDVRPGDLAVARNVLDHGWLIGLAAAANLVAAAAVMAHRATGWLLAVVIAGTGAGLGAAMYVAVQASAASVQGTGMAAVATVAYVLVIASLLIAPHPRSA